MAVRVGNHSGRVGAKGVYSPKHNDRNFPVDHARHIDQSKSAENVYWIFNKQKIRLEKCVTNCNPGSDDYESTVSFDEHERLVYNSLFSEQLAKSNDKYIKQRHKEKCQDMEHFRTKNKQHCPEETLLYLGDSKECVDVEIFKKILQIYWKWHQETFPLCLLLDAALHLDERTPHAHERMVWTASYTVYAEHYNAEQNEKAERGELKRKRELEVPNEDYLIVNQTESLRQMGITPPNPDAKTSRHNNAKQTYSRMCREKLAEIAKQFGVEIIFEPKEDGENGMELAAYKVREAQKEIAELEEQKKSLASEVKTLQAESATVQTGLETLRKEAEQLGSQAQESVRLAKQNNRLKQNLMQAQEELRTIKTQQELAESTIATLQQVAKKIREENFEMQREQHELLPELEKLRTLAPLADDFAEIVQLARYPLPPEPEKPKKKFGESDANYEKREAAYQDALKQYRAELDKVPGVQKLNSLVKRLQQVSWNLDDARRQAEKEIQNSHIDGKLLCLMRELNTTSLPDGSESLWKYYRKQKEYAKNDKDLMETLSADSLGQRQEQRRLAEEREMLLREQAYQSRKIQDADQQETEKENFER